VGGGGVVQILPNIAVFDRTVIMKINYINEL